LPEYPVTTRNGDGGRALAAPVSASVDLWRPDGLFLALALLLGVVATVFGALAVPPGHHHQSAAGHDEHSTPVAEHADESEEEDATGADEGIAALAISIFAIGLVPIGIRSTRSASRPDVLHFAVAVASAGAATIHFAVVDQHLAEYWLFGVFFVAVALAQLGWMVAIVSSPTRPLYVVGALGNALVVLTWVVSRTIGLPLGPHAGDPEAVGVADAVSTAFELVVVIGTVLLLKRVVSRNSGDTSIVRPLIALAAIATTALALTSI
jgi:hypothetical protein